MVIQAHIHTLIHSWLLNFHAQHIYVPQRINEFLCWKQSANVFCGVFTRFKTLPNLSLNNPNSTLSIFVGFPVGFILYFKTSSTDRPAEHIK